MSKCNLFTILVAFTGMVAMAATAAANPVPWPVPASMPLEDMYSYLDLGRDRCLRETFTGNYYFSYIPEDVDQMKYPVPPGSSGISAAMGKLPEDWYFTPGIFPYLHETQVPMNPLEWFYIRELYPTVLPEWSGWSGIPMIGWNGPFPEKAVLNVKYQHDLLKCGRDYVYFYALGTGKYYQTYQKEATAFLDISMPTTYDMRRLFLDHTPYAFATTCETDQSGQSRTIVSIYAAAQFGPFTRDIIGYIKPACSGMDVSSMDTLLKSRMDTSVKAAGDADGTRAEGVQEAGSARGDSGKDSIASGKWKTDVRNHSPSAEKSTLMCAGSQIRLLYKTGEQCSEAGPPPGVKLEVVPVDRNMIITDAIHFNCCPEYIRMTILVSGNQVIFREKAMEEAPCDCICYFPMKGVAGPFAPGVYQVEVIDPYGKGILETEIVIR